MQVVKRGPGIQLRKRDKSHAVIILRVQQYFDKERDQKLCPEVAQLVKRTSKAIGLNKFILNKIRTTAL